MYFLLIVLVTCFSQMCLADLPTSQELKASTQQLEKDWNEAKKEYKHKFKVQMAPVETKIKELKKALDNGDPKKRAEINDEMRQMKILRDRVRNDFHEITVTSIVDIAGMQKHFMNAKDDTKD